MEKIKKKNAKLEDINKDERNQIILDFAKEFQGFKNQFNSMEKPSFGILLDEKALLTISEDEQIQNIFLDIAKDAESVICCRVSPLQKSQVVKMMKNYDQKGITLAIGDGGNDVPMIMEAHIGVGIYGEEGLRAVQSSDYAIGEFKVLRELLFSHGRMNNVRNSECIHYFFFKNFVQTFGHFIYGFYCNFTGQTIIDDWFITLYNLLFTSLPLGTKAILDTDLTRDDGTIIYKLLPFIYQENRDNPIFTIPNFILNLTKGLFFSFINTFAVIYSIENIPVNEGGKMAGLWFLSVDIYTNILIIVTVTLLITTKFHTVIHFIILAIVTFLAYIVFLTLVQKMALFNSVGTISVAFSSPVLWLNLFLVSGSCGLIEYFILCFYFIFKPNTISILKRKFAEKGKIETTEGLPKSIIEKINIYDDIVEKVDDTIIIHKKTENSIKSKTENREENNNNKKTEDENSKDILIKGIFTDRGETNGGDLKLLNNIDLNNIHLSNGLGMDNLEENQETEGNVSSAFSEQMSKENNLYFTNNCYFVDNCDYPNKIIHRETNFKDN